MAEQPAPVDSAPAPPAGQDALDSAIAQMEATLPELQSGREQTPSPADAKPTGELSAPTEQPAAKPAPEPGGDIDEESSDPSFSEPPAPTSRMGRLRVQLEQAETKARQAETALNARRAQETEAVRQFIDLVLPDQQFEQLRVQAESGDWEAKQKLDVARTWRRMATPIADLAHAAVQKQFDAALAELRTLDGMDGEVHQQLLSAPTPGDKLKLMHRAAMKAAEAQHKDRIAALEEEVRTLKTGRAANGSQPANGGAPAGGLSGLSGLIGRDGQLTDDALSLTPAEIRQRFGVAR